MMNKRFYLATLLLGLGQAVICPPLVAAEEESKQVSEKDIKASLEKIVFVPHDVGAPEATDSGGVRGITPDAPKFHVLAPERLSLSLSSSPTLYWYLTGATSDPVRFQLIKDGPSAFDPVLDVSLGAFANQGIYAIALSEFGVRLEAGQRYTWSVGLATSSNTDLARPVASTLLEHFPSSDVQSLLISNSPLDQTAELAQSGYWFDAIDVISRQIETGERTVPWHEVRAHLLDQVGLDKIAAYDRLQAGD